MINFTLQMQQFINHCKIRKALNDKIIKTYGIDLSQFVKCTNNTFSKETICHYIDTLYEQFKPKTIRRRIVSIKAFIHYLLIQEIIEINPFVKTDVSFKNLIIA